MTALWIALWLLGCHGDTDTDTDSGTDTDTDSGTDTDTDSGTDTDTDSGTDTDTGDSSTVTCDHTGITVNTQSAAWLYSDTNLHFDAADAVSNPTELLTIDLWSPGATFSGSYTFPSSGTDWPTWDACTTCVYLTASSGKQYLAQEGELAVTSVSAPGTAGATFSGTLSDVVFEEMDVSTHQLLENGETWCISELNFSANTPD